MLFSRGIGKCQNWKVSESIFARFGRNWKMSEVESVRIGKCQNWKVSELESVKFFWSLKIPYKWAKLCLSSILSVWHVPIEVSNDMVCTIMVTQASFFPTFKESENSNTFQFWHFPILTLSNSDAFQFWHFPILTLSSLSFSHLFVISFLNRF